MIHLFISSIFMFGIIIHAFVTRKKDKFTLFDFYLFTFLICGVIVPLMTLMLIIET
jgi:hypothetical protein